MLFYFNGWIKENKAYKKQVDGKGNTFICFHRLPCFFHFFTPMNIVENHQAFMVQVWQHLFKISQRWFEPVIAIDIGHING